jgi:hypothetical protein
LGVDALDRISHFAKGFISGVFEATRAEHAPSRQVRKQLENRSEHERLLHVRLGNFAAHHVRQKSEEEIRCRQVVSARGIIQHSIEGWNMEE